MTELEIRQDEHAQCVAKIDEMRAQRDEAHKRIDELDLLLHDAKDERDQNLVAYKAAFEREASALKTAAESQAREVALREALSRLDRERMSAAECEIIERALDMKTDTYALREFGFRVVNRATGIRDDFRCVEGYAVVDAVLKD